MGTGIEALICVAQEKIILYASGEEHGGNFTFHKIVQSR